MSLCAGTIWMLPYIEAGLGLKRKHLIAISLLVGNDHDLNGVQGVGLEKACCFVWSSSEDKILDPFVSIPVSNLVSFVFLKIVLCDWARSNLFSMQVTWNWQWEHSISNWLKSFRWFNAWSRWEPSKVKNFSLFLLWASKQQKSTFQVNLWILCH